MQQTDISLDDVRFVVVDVETTGGTGGDHRITELGFCVIEDGVIVRRYSSLVNPHQVIPDFIVTMTGITNEMVASAPDEDDVVIHIADELRRDGTVFVAHNVGFDWGFVSAALQRCNEDVPDMIRLCTCKLSRRVSAGLPRHDLGSVAAFYNVPITARHRALGDAEATAHALMQMLDRARSEHEAQTLDDLLALQYAKRAQPRRETKARALLEPYLKELPDEPGVYYFLNTKKKILYVGKAKSLVKRVSSYFQDTPLHSRKVARMIRYIRHIRWEPTGTELGAMLLESREIKVHRPSYNQVGREYRPPIFLRITNEDFPQFELVDGIVDDGSEHFGPFRSERMAQRLLDMVVREHQLRTCDGELKPEPDYRPCFNYHIKKCLAPCALLQTKDDYQQRVREARSFIANVERGAVGRLQQQMAAAADRLEYERAALLRDGIKELERVTLHQQDTPLAVSDTNVILVMPTQDRYSTVEVFFVRAGRLRVQRIVGTSAPLDALYAAADEVYFSAAVDGPFDERELDALRIITSWLYRRRDKADVIVVNGLAPFKLQERIMAAVRRYHKGIVETPPDETPSEYSQLPDWTDAAA
ncbi:MAG: hypothetical protein FGM24_00295 [Candidatus Kapabacteria bacterium]|nr:hypothetical protein [Candidatus Kapabacteria bacterium]